MPVLHIIAVGPPASGKSQLVRYFARNLPEGYKLERESTAIPEAFGHEYWVLKISKVKQRKANAKALRPSEQ